MEFITTLVMAAAYYLPQYRSSTHLRSNPLYTCMSKIGALLIAPAQLIQRLLISSCSSFLHFISITHANTQQVLPVQTGMFCTGMTNEWCQNLTMKT